MAVVLARSSVTDLAQAGLSQAFATAALDSSAVVVATLALPQDSADSRHASHCLLYYSFDRYLWSVKLIECWTILVCLHRQLALGAIHLDTYQVLSWCYSCDGNNDDHQLLRK